MNIKPKKYDLDPLANFMGDVMEQLKSLTIMKNPLEIDNLTINPIEDNVIEIELGDMDGYDYGYLFLTKDQAKQIIEYLQQQIS